MSAPKSLPEGWQEKAYELFKQGKSYNEISTETGVSFSSIAKLASKDRWSEKKRFTGRITKDLSPESVEHLWRQNNDEVKTAIRDLIAQGKRLKTAAALFGWTTDDVKKWMADDEVFRRRIAQAVAIFECKLTNEVKEYDGKDWKAKTYLLETHEELKDVYKNVDDDKNKLSIVVNLDRPTISEFPQISVVPSEKPAITYDNVVDAELVDVKQLPKPLERKPRVKKTPEQIAQERVDAHNKAILKKRQDERRRWWAEQEAKKNGTESND